MLAHMEGMFKEVRKYLLEKGFKETLTKIVHEKKKDIAREFDIAVEDIVINYCKRNRIDTVLLTEEQGEVVISENPENIIVLDPVDGSTNFSRGVEGTAFSAAVLPYNKEGIMRPSEVGHAFIGSVISGAFVKGSKGKGAIYKGPFSGWKEIETRVSENKLISTACIEVDLDFGLDLTDDKTPEKEAMNHIFSFLKKIKYIRRNGSAALGMMQVAHGAVDAYVDVRGISKPENWMAAYLLIKEAGGVFTDPRGNDIGNVKNMETSTDYIASCNQEIHETILKLLPPK